MKVLFQCLAIGCGGFFGSLARWGVAQLFGRLFTTQFPLGTFVINITGSLFLGWFLTFIAGRYPVSDTMRLAVATGFVGAYTTFSTFMYESTVLSDDGARLQAMTNLIGSLIVGLVAVKLGMIIAKRV